MARKRDDGEDFVPMMDNCEICYKYLRPVYDTDHMMNQIYMAWKPKGSGKFNHVYYIGARTGKKIGQKKDAWFQLIVEQDQQFIKGNNRHVGVLGDFVDTDKPKIFKKLLQAYKQEFPKRFK